MFLFSLFVFSSFCYAAESPTSLTWKNYKEVSDYVIGEPSNNNYLKVDWQKTVMDGQVLGAKEDKPILLWLYFGGPLGNC